MQRVALQPPDEPVAWNDVEKFNINALFETGFIDIADTAMFDKMVNILAYGDPEQAIHGSVEDHLRHLRLFYRSLQGMVQYLAPISQQLHHHVYALEHENKELQRKVDRMEKKYSDSKKTIKQLTTQRKEYRRLLDRYESLVMANAQHGAKCEVCGKVFRTGDLMLEHCDRHCEEPSIYPRDTEISRQKHAEFAIRFRSERDKGPPEDAEAQVGGQPKMGLAELLKLTGTRPTQPDVPKRDFNTELNQLMSTRERVESQYFIGQERPAPPLPAALPDIQVNLDESQESASPPPRRPPSPESAPPHRRPPMAQGGMSESETEGSLSEEEWIV
ncbi:Zinc finger C2H2 type domain [Carpediemonas membranifera]|uniref:Zinc finger C2H2 type domain n=1 Tax=Carpediemonas membranifera TaxID=201153 RepID=A0A8J6E4N2_9EUKA|nr:Zinc finger C2H2 type domain [Carpediemonas membranifera]|eukprot:KAG9397403.1 Zinc finger C2H2 type domain [Carpediemonas membranifera]